MTSAAIWRFEHGDREMLAARIEDGSATAEERQVAADFIRGKLKSPDGRAVRAYRRQQRDGMLLLNARFAQSKGIKTESIVAAIEAETGLKRRAILGIIKKPKAARKTKKHKSAVKKTRPSATN